MPKFIYTVIVFTLILWGMTLFLGSQLSPESFIAIFIFSLTLFIALGMSFTLITFFVLNVRASLFLDKHVLFRKSLKLGYFVGFCLTGGLVIRALGVGSVVNYLLFVALSVLIYTQVNS